MAKTKLDVGADVTYLAIKPEALEYFIEWAALSTKMRPKGIESQAKLAVHLGVTEQTIRNWKRDERVIDRIQQISVSAIRIERYSSLLDSAFEQAMDTKNPRSIAATKILLEEMNRHGHRQESTALSDKSNAELKALVAELYDEFDERSTSTLKA